MLNPAFVIHSRPYRETSQLVEVFTQDSGRFTLVARGSRGPRSPLKGLLQPFTLLTIAWRRSSNQLAQRQAQAKMPRLNSMPAPATGTVVMMLLSLGFGLFLAHTTGLHPATLILGTSPGGIAEMAITAKVLQLGVPVVTAFQVCRLVAVLILVGPLYKWVCGPEKIV